MCISTYALNTFAWLLLREVPVAVGDTLRRDPKVSGWQADRAAPAGWSAVFWGLDSQEDVRSSLAVCLGCCGPALLRSKHRNLGRGRRGGKAQAVTDDFERSVSFYPMTGGAGVEKGHARVTAEVMGRHSGCEDGLCECECCWRHKEPP